MEISIQDDEKALLVRVVQEYYANLRAEIHRTEAHDFKAQLKGEEAVVEGILKKLGAPLTPGSAS